MNTRNAAEETDTRVVPVQGEAGLNDTKKARELPRCRSAAHHEMVRNGEDFDEPCDDGRSG